jgi:ParB family transcriptional regulator, chromosome partitioning protein
MGCRGNLSRVSSRTASTIEAIAKKGNDFENILIELAEDIRKGIGSRRLEKLADETLLGDSKEISPDGTIIAPSGAVVGILKNNQLKFSKGVIADQERFIKHLVKFF